MNGTVKEELGLLFKGPNFVIVKKSGVAGNQVEKHNHPEANVIFTVVNIIRRQRIRCKPSNKTRIIQKHQRVRPRPHLFCFTCKRALAISL